MEWRDNEGVPQLVFGEKSSIGEGLGKELFLANY